METQRFRQLIFLVVGAAVVTVVAVFALHSNKPALKPTALPVIQVLGVRLSTIEHTYPIDDSCSQIVCFGGTVKYPGTSLLHITGPRFYGVSTSGLTDTATPSGIINLYSQRLPMGLNLAQAIREVTKYFPADFRVTAHFRSNSSSGSCEIVDGTSATLAAAHDPRGVVGVMIGATTSSKWVYSLTSAAVYEEDFPAGAVC